jgi:hypothetical protein
MDILAAIGANDPTTILAGLVAAVSSMALYIVRISQDRVAREKEISGEYREARDAAVTALTNERQRREETLMATMQEIVKTNSIIESNIALVARAVVIPRARGEKKLDDQ